MKINKVIFVLSVKLKADILSCRPCLHMLFEYEDVMAINVYTYVAVLKHLFSYIFSYFSYIAHGSKYTHIITFKPQMKVVLKYVYCTLQYHRFFFLSTLSGSMLSIPKDYIYHGTQKRKFLNHYPVVGYLVTELNSFY